MIAGFAQMKDSSKAIEGGACFSKIGGPIQVLFPTPAGDGWYSTTEICSLFDKAKALP
jgi:hypothetical protein